MTARAIAFYLPQFHPIRENDIAHGKGFTEWTNVTKAVPLFPGHIQPKLPADLGFYDLRLPEVRKQQADMASKYGIEGFCYWHYWLGNGRRLLEKPFNEVLNSGEPNFPFCLGWANHDWSGKGWMGGATGEDIIQQYPSKKDAEDHFLFLLKAFKDKRYIRKNGKPVFVIYRPAEIPQCKEYLDYWRKLADQNGLPGLFIIGDAVPGEPSKLGLDAALYSGQRHLPKDVWEVQGSWEKLHSKNLKKIQYSKVIKYLVPENGFSDDLFPVIIPNWDTSPRLGDEAMIFYNNNPAFFKIHVTQILDMVSHRKDDENLVFIRAWNEWAEGNYLEPDLEFGLSYLETLKSCLDDFKIRLRKKQVIGVCIFQIVQ